MSGGFGYWIADLPRVIFCLATFGNRLPEIRGPPSRQPKRNWASGGHR